MARKLKKPSDKTATAPKAKAARKAKPIPATPRQPARVATRRETELLDRINIGFSEPQALRFQELDSLREKERLTSAEVAEFLALADASERMRNNRFEALVELAGLRGVSVASLMARMGLGFSGG
jgi:hypothetical protein